MISMLCIVLLVVSLAAIVFFQGSVFFGLVTAGLAFLGILINLKICPKSKLIRVLLPVGCSVLVLICCFSGSRSAEFGCCDYHEQINGCLSCFANEDDAKLKKNIDSIREKYGDSDETRYLLAAKAVQKNQFEEAGDLLYGFEDKTSVLYYQVKEQILMNEHSEDDDYSDLKKMYIEASDQNPEWVYANEKAGSLCLNDKEYEKAAYYFSKAYANIEFPDPELSYYLGVVMMKQGYTDKGYYLFCEAVDNGADDEIKARISDYADKMTGGAE